jgi:hypothetical protein
MSSAAGNNVIFVSGTGADFSANSLASLTDVAIQANGGAHLTLPGLTSCTWNTLANPTAITADGAGTQINLAAFTHLTFNDGFNNAIQLTVSATNGAHITAASLNTVTLGTSHTARFTADGTGTQITITALLPPPAGVTTSATNGATIS